MTTNVRHLLAQMRRIRARREKMNPAARIPWVDLHSGVQHGSTRFATGCANGPMILPFGKSWMPFAEIIEESTTVRMKQGGEEKWMDMVHQTCLKACSGQDLML